jgi:hypothetical protein
MMYHRAFTWTCALLAVALLSARAMQAVVPACPLKQWSGRPCPTCGLTSSAWSTLHGEWQEAFHFHWFGPVLLALGMVVLVGCTLPAKPRRRFINWLTRWEMRVRGGWILLGAFVIYALVRFLC